MSELITIGLILLCTLAPIGFGILKILERKEDQKQREFEVNFQKEQYERDRKVFQAKCEGNLTIDKLTEIYYPKQQSKPEVEHE